MRRDTVGAETPPPKPPKRVNPETIIRKAVVKYLESQGWFVYPNTQGIGSHRGLADLTAIRNGAVVWIEIKTPTGKQSYYQWEFEQAIRAHGGLYCVVRGVDDLREVEA